VTFRIYPPAKCHECGKLIGFAGQGPVYSGADGFDYCETHIDWAWRIKVNNAQARIPKRGSIRNNQ